MSTGAWLESRTRRAPATLRARVLELARAVPGSAGAGAGRDLADAAEAALADVAPRCTDRAAALDLLAADALITLALLARAERDPASLGAFAAELVRDHVARAGA
mgnify:CR=1 FL=1